MVQEGFWAGLCKLQTVHFRPLVPGTEFGSFCVGHVQTRVGGRERRRKKDKNKGRRLCLDDTNKKEQLDGALPARRPSCPCPALSDGRC